MRYISMDIDRKNASVRINNTITGQRHEMRVALLNSEEDLQRFLDSLQPEDVLGLESQPGAFYLHDRFKPHVKQTHILESHWLGGIIKSRQNKNDRNDCGTIGECMVLDAFKSVWVPPVEVRVLRTMCSQYKDFTTERTRYVNRIHALLVDYGVGSLANWLLKADVRSVNVKLSKKLPPHVLDVVARNLRLVKEFEAQLADLTAQLQLTDTPGIDLVKTMPGLDTILATIVLSAIGDIKRFKTDGSLVNYCLAPALNTTGGKTRHGKTKERGCRNLRFALVEAAHSAVRVEGKLKAFYINLMRRRRGHQKAIVATACEMARILWHMLTKDQPFRDLPEESAKRKQGRTRRKSQQAQQIIKKRLNPWQTIATNIGTIREVCLMMAPHT